MINYKSTRGDATLLNSAQTIIQGIAEDKGLFVPEVIPALKRSPEAMIGLSYQEIAFDVLSQFLTDYSDVELKSCIDKAYDDKFEDPQIAPLVQAGDVYFLELYHGKTAAFKDMALSLLPHLLTTAMKKEKEEKKIAILTATSGDTGKAALEGFADVPDTDIIVFYPSEGVSQVQERQMTTQEGGNTHVFGIKGNFDDAQTGVKKIFNDFAFARELAGKGYRLSSANSINIGRLVPQVAYYVYAYVQLLARNKIKSGDAINVVVPTGNFGNILAAYYAKRMGLPIGKFICASNKNQILTDFINSGTYNIDRPFYLTNTPSMDILISSNLERLLYHLSNGNGSQVAGFMGGLEKNQCYTVDSKVKAGLKEFYGGTADDAETNAAIGKVYSTDHYLMDVQSL
jgi:threonine synthase